MRDDFSPSLLALFNQIVGALCLYTDILTSLRRPRDRNLIMSICELNSFHNTIEQETTPYDIDALHRIDKNVTNWKNILDFYVSTLKQNKRPAWERIPLAGVLDDLNGLQSMVTHRIDQYYETEQIPRPLC